MIPKVSRGADMPGLMAYLFGPGRHNEHVDQHVVAAYDGCGAESVLWQSQRGEQRRVLGEARRLGHEIDYPHARWRVDVARGHVWHCSLSIPAEEGPLTDEQWAIAARTVVDRLGFSAASGHAPCRWAAVRHGTSTGGNDHIHIAVDLVREDGTRASTWKDYPAVGKVATELETRFGLAHVEGRIRGASLGEASRADREITARHDGPSAQPLRHRLEQRVRAVAGAQSSETEFVAQLRHDGLLVRPRWGQDGTVTGYAVAEDPGRGGRTGLRRDTGTRGPIWFGGGTLATDLTLPRLRAGWDAAARRRPGTGHTTRNAGDALQQGVNQLGAEPDGASVTNVAAPLSRIVAVLAVTYDHRPRGPWGQAERHLARLAQTRRPPRADLPVLVGDVADEVIDALAIQSTTEARAMLALMREVSKLCDVIAETTAASRDARQAATYATKGLQTAETSPLGHIARGIPPAIARTMVAPRTRHRDGAAPAEVTRRARPQPPPGPRPETQRGQSR